MENTRSFLDKFAWVPLSCVGSGKRGAWGERNDDRGLQVRQTGSTLRTALAFVCAFALVLVAVPAIASAECPNEDLRLKQGATTLPGCLALELANPPAKSSQPALLPSFSRDGQRLQIKIEAAVAETPGYQSFNGDTYVASRTADGWLSRPTAPLDPTIVNGGARTGNPATFTPDLSRWTQFGSSQVQRMVGIARLYGGGLDGLFTPLSPLLVPIEENPNGELQYIVPFLEVDGSSNDLRVNVFRGLQSTFGYLPEDPHSPGPGISEPGGDRNSYVASLDENDDRVLELLARDKDDEVWGGRCGAHLGGEEVTFNQGAIAVDGQRIFFTTRPAQPWDPDALAGPPCSLANPLRILRRTSTPGGPVIEEITPGGPAAPGDDFFQAASADSSRVYLTTPRKLAGNDADPSSEACSATLGASKGCDLYLYDANRPEGDRMVQVSAGGAGDPDPGKGADVLSSITAVSGDGSHAYFVAQGFLTADPNPEGATATAGQPNLYLYEADTGQISFIGTMLAADRGGVIEGGVWGAVGSFFGDASAVPLYGPDLEGGGDGHVLVFASKASLTADDLDGGFRDVFRYDAVADTLERVSKAAAGGEDNGPFDARVNPAIKGPESNFGEATRWASEDGQTIAFATAEPLLPGGDGEALNPYVWDEGQLGAVLAPITIPPAVAPVGRQLAFSTVSALLGRDQDTAPDVYVAREGGGFLEPPPPTPCNPLIEGIQAGGCRDFEPPPPHGSTDTGASTAGNVKEPTKCKKGQVKRKGKCVSRKGKRKAGKHGQRGGNK